MEHGVSESIARNHLAERKLALRKALSQARRDAGSQPAANDALDARLRALLERLAPRTVGFYWPLPGEFDARAAVLAWRDAQAGRQAALPVIREQRAPLEFHAWDTETPMREGHHRIPEPASGVVVVPDLLLIPCVGFDTWLYRLGYGGGYYDRTLAAWPGDALPVTVGIAYEACRVDALPAEDHDLAMRWVVTDEETYVADA
ncbi:5-formyltetrahydrofolate cyclo-ligase [Burkholderia stagnalis]|uniref:5-formyltetrahydrofolate cyclo-ligase n=1 Tax=Burkholderia stagnalis TaxID=1503054 RepID=A0A104NGX7_9BURK|nr:5-formyltetrahydrofolate cyclo-ligase [Burkholderia stagnalis]AOK54075.1 5-formyltetrahydrofolate cyclo-ligase [Burkholderia stagnalis]KVC64779.1 5-formyltetrahydrofolate cyclo-ligase [Burkholderia stagnalis]KVD90925.1 5-formyltetrahydrofolate cyclo-ligase [Burkholderia stagnalis]KVL87123.1 5-formyltetrahydrofolate cyclo-ligase [Burkholderia stagnalis]KVL98747.1 5-formyltetrahydrofolate cyclo-ligase [Burkholderia stagnalis]